jgi:hypothetical protein
VRKVSLGEVFRIACGTCMMECEREESSLTPVLPVLRARFACPTSSCTVSARVTSTCAAAWGGPKCMQHEPMEANPVAWASAGSHTPPDAASSPLRYLQHAFSASALRVCSRRWAVCRQEGSAHAPP